MWMRGSFRVQGCDEASKTPLRINCQTIVSHHKRCGRTVTEFVWTLRRPTDGGGTNAVHGPD
jgi:hypothetical protein